MNAVDLNADLGEGYGNDAALMEIVTSANVACGWHAGDEQTMRDVVRLALHFGVAIGAHPSYPDRANFGRSPMPRSADDVYSDVSEQIRILAAVAAAEGGALHHVKAHGALYNAAARDRVVAGAIARAVRDFDSTLLVYGLAGSEITGACRDLGLRAVEEIFADRHYTIAGALVPREEPGALIHDAKESVAQTLSMIRRGIGETVCVHGDTPQAVALARALRSHLATAGIALSRAG